MSVSHMSCSLNMPAYQKHTVSQWAEILDNELKRSDTNGHLPDKDQPDLKMYTTVALMGYQDGRKHLEKILDLMTIVRIRTWLACVEGYPGFMHTFSRTAGAVEDNGNAQFTKGMR